MTIKKETGLAPKSILFDSEHKLAIGVQLANTGVAAGSDGRKIVKAGTPIGGATNVLENRATAMVVTNLAGDGANAQGVLLHDVDVTAGNANATMLVWGYVKLNGIDVAPVAEAKTALKGKVTFINA